MKSKRCANDVRCWKLTWRVTGLSHVVVFVDVIVDADDVDADG